MAISLKALYQGAKDKLTSANKKAEALGATAFDTTQSVVDKIKTEKNDVVGGIKDAYGGKSISDITNEAMTRLGTGGKKLGELAGTASAYQPASIITAGIQAPFSERTFSEILSDRAKKASGEGGLALESIALTPQKVTEGLRSGIDTSADALGLYKAGADKTKVGSKILKSVVDPALGLVSALPMPVFIQATTKATGLDKYMAKGVDEAKTGTSDILKLVGVDNDVADELGSTLIDGAQTLLSIRGAKSSSKAGGTAKVQTLSNAARQNKILKTIETKAAQAPGATKASIKAAVDAARPTVMKAQASPLSFGDVAKHNIKMLGYDVAANTAIPILGLAYQSVKDGEYGSIPEALESFVSNAGLTLSTAIPGAKIKKTKSKPSPEQMSMDTEVKTPDYTKPTPKETLKEIAQKRKDYLADLEGKREDYSRKQEFDKITADREAESLKFASEQERKDYLAEMEKNRAEMYKAQDEAKIADEQQQYMKDRADEFNTLQSERDTQTQQFAETINKPSNEFFTKFQQTNPTVAQAKVANEMRTKLDQGESPANIMRSTLLSRVQKELIIKDYQDSVTQRQNEQAPVKTFEEKIAEGEQVAKEEGTTIKNETPPTRTGLAGTLDNILNSFNLGDNTFVSKSKNALNSIGTIGGYIEKGMTDIGGQKINLRNISQSVRNSGNLFANKILENFGIDKRTESFDTLVKIKEKDLIGGITPNEGTAIDKGNVKVVMDIMNNIIPDNMKNFIAGSKKQLSDIENLAKAEYLYYVNRNNPDKLNTLFTPDQQAKIESRIAMSRDIPDQLSTYLVEKNLISSKQLAEDYVRYVISQKGREKFANPVTINLGKEKYRFESVEDALTSIAARRASGEGKIADAMEANLSSLMKEKATGIDLYRVHSPTLQILSYAQNVGKFLQNKATLDNFRTFAEGSQEQKAFISKLFPEGKVGSEKIEQIIGVNRKDASALGKAMNALANVTRGVSKYILAGRPSTFVQAILTALPRGLALTAKTSLSDIVRTKKLSNPVGVLKEMNNPQVLETLGNNGFLPEHQPFDVAEKAITSESVPSWIKNPINAADAFVGKMAVEFSGRAPEQLAKKMYVLGEMRSILEKNGVKLESKDALSTTKAWEEWARNPENRAKYLIEQDKIQENLSWIGESTIFNKSMSDTVRKTNWQALTGFANGQVNKAMTDFGRIVGGIESSKDQKLAAAGRTAVTWAQWGTVAALAYAYLQDEENPVNDEVAKSMAFQYANRMVGNPLQMFYSVTSGITGSPVTGAVDLMSQAAGIGTSLIAGDEGTNVRVQKFLDTLIKMQGGLQAANVKGALSQMVADNVTGAFSTKNMTKSGKASGRTDTEDSYLEEALGMNKDSYVLNYMYDKITDTQMKQSLEGTTIPESLRPATANVLSTAKSYLNNIVRPIQELVDYTKGTNIDYAEQQRIANVYRKITPVDTFSSFSEKLGITDPNLQGLLRTEVMKTLVSEANKNIDVAQAIQDEGYTKSWDDEFGKEMEIIRTSNPKLYNQVIAGMGRILAENDKRLANGIELLGGTKRDADFISSKMGSEPTLQDDAVISALTGDNPNSTALSQTVVNFYQDLMQTATTSEEIKNGMSVMNNLFSGIYNANPYADGIERSLSLASIGFINKLKEEGKYEGAEKLWALMNGTPFVRQALQNGLKYRGWTSLLNDKSTTGQQPTDTSEPMTTSSSRSTPGTMSSTATTTTPLDQAIEGYKLEKPVKTAGPQKVTLTELIRQQQKLGATNQRMTPQKQSDLRLKTQFGK